jgi:hypothetical protein
MAVLLAILIATNLDQVLLISYSPLYLYLPLLSPFHPYPFNASNDFLSIRHCAGIQDE